MIDPYPTPADLAGLKGRRFRLHKQWLHMSRGATGIVSSIVFHRGASHIEIEWELPGRGRIPITDIVTREELHDYFTEC